MAPRYFIDSPEAVWLRGFSHHTEMAPARDRRGRLKADNLPRVSRRLSRGRKRRRRSWRADDRVFPATSGLGRAYSEVRDGRYQTCPESAAEFSRRLEPLPRSQKPQLSLP